MNLSPADALPSSQKPLSRNRNYNILWSSHFFSDLGSEITFVAFPLLILAVSGSPLQMGLVSSALAIARMAANVPAGVIADRLDRRAVMLVCQGIRGVAMGGLALTLILDRYSFAYVLVAAVIEGLLSSVFGPAEDASIPQVVPREQLSQAVARNTARPFVASLLGPVAAGFLFTVQRVIPFVVDAVLLVLSFFGLLFLRLPVREKKEVEATVRADVAGGFRWVLGNRVIRTTLVWVVLFNLLFHALVIIILASAGEDHVGAGEMGLMMAFLGAGGLIGGVVAARLQAALPAPLIIIGFSWIAAVMTAAMAAVPSGVLLGVLLGGSIVFAPVANTVVLTYQMVITPDELRGRLSGIVAFCAGGAGAIGPLAGGLLMSGGSDLGILACAGGLAVVAAGATLSPTLRKFPTIREGAVEAEESLL